MGDMVPLGGMTAAIYKPKEVLKQAQEVANILMDFVRKKEMAKKFGTSEHIMLPAWQFAGHFYGYTAKTTKTEPYQDEITGAYGFKAWADVVRIDGSVASSAEALCLNNEDNWDERPKYEWRNGDKTQVGSVKVPSYQLMSMAQTRAMSKALANVLRFVVVLAGYESTPAEEMHHSQQAGKDTERKSDQQANKTAQQQGGGGNQTGLITEGQVKRLYAIRKDKGCPQSRCGEIVLSFGFSVVPNITKDKYDAVVAAIEGWQAWEAPQQKQASGAPSEELPT